MHMHKSDLKAQGMLMITGYNGRFLEEFNFCKCKLFQAHNILTLKTSERKTLEKHVEVLVAVYFLEQKQWWRETNTSQRTAKPMLSTKNPSDMYLSVLCSDKKSAWVATRPGPRHTWPCTNTWVWSLDDPKRSDDAFDMSKRHEKLATN